MKVRKDSKCIVEPGHEKHYGVMRVRQEGNRYLCRCRGCGKTWIEYRDEEPR
jgi:hypothetical protein